MQPTVSIIVPAYNAGAWVGETVGSVLAQSFEDYELIIVDDGSSDNTLDVVQKALAGSKIRYEIQRLPRNGGVSAARNLGVDLASGRFLMFLDADDVLTPDALLQHVEVLNTEVDVSYAQWDFVWRSEAAKVLQQPLQKPFPDDLVAVLQSSDGGWWVPTGAVVLRREIVDAVDREFGGFRHELYLGEDVHYYACLQQLGARFRPTNRLGAYYRYSPRSVSRSASVFKKALSFLWVVDYWINRLGPLQGLQDLRRQKLASLSEGICLEITLTSAMLGGKNRQQERTAQT